nr:DNA polymerase III subunit gamma and tau [Propioniciclava flava]
MADDDALGLFDEDDLGESADARLEYEQDGPDLFGLEPDELILPTEPTPLDDPEMEIELDSMDEIPIDAEDEPEVEATMPDPLIEQAIGSSVEDAAGPHDDDAAVTAPAEFSGPSPEASAVQSIPPAPEAPLALYRRYRPETFDQVIGQDHVTEPLKRALVNNRVSHAYLFSGPRGCGKTTSARILARCLNCEQGPTPTPCGVCQSCRDLARGGSGSIDVIEIDAASHGGVDEARDLRERAFFAPVHSRYKIYIIDEAHMVTNAGFNALLKVVEEPPPHVKFIFATTEPEKVIGTIRSRTHHYPFRLVPPRTMAAYLAELCKAEGVQVDQAVLPLVVRAGAGSVRDSLSVLDQLLGGAAEAGVSYTQAASLLGYTPESLLDEIMDAFAAGDAQGVFACIDKVIEVGQDPRRFAEDLLRRLRDLIIVAAVPDALETGLVDVAGDQAERLTTQASGMGSGELTRAAEVIAQGLTDMRGTTAPRLHLELMCARVLLPGADVAGRGIHARLDRLERRLQMDPLPEAETPGAHRTGRRPRPEASTASAPAHEPASAARGGQPSRGTDTAAPPAGSSEPRPPAADPGEEPARPRRQPAGPEADRPGSSGQATAAEHVDAPTGPDAGVADSREGLVGPTDAGSRDVASGESAGHGDTRRGEAGPDGSGSSAGEADRAAPADATTPDARPAGPNDSGPGDSGLGDSARPELGRAQPAAGAGRGSAPEPPYDPYSDDEPPFDPYDEQDAGRNHAGAGRPSGRPGGSVAGQERPPQGGAPGAATQEGRRGRRPQAPATPTPAPEVQPVESWSINAAPTPTTPQQPREAAPAGANEPEAAPVTAGLGTADLRARWPEVLDAVRSRRRVTWIILRENAQVHTFADGVLTLALNNPGALESFARGGSDQIVREAVLHVLGVAPTVKVIAGGGGDDGPVDRPAAPPAPAQERRSAPEATHQHAERARANIEPTRVGPTDEPEPLESLDDPDIDDQALGSAELIAKVLGGQLIADEDPDQV